MKIRRKARLLAEAVARARSWSRGPFHASWKTAKNVVVGVRVVVWQPKVQSRLIGAPPSEMVAVTLEIAALSWTLSVGVQW